MTSKKRTRLSLSHRSPAKKERDRKHDAMAKGDEQEAEEQMQARVPPEGQHQCEPTPPERPLVIYCSKCNTIFGDTSSFVCTHAGLKTITLAEATMVTSKGNEHNVEAEIDSERRRFTAGSMFYRLHCKSCDQCVGKVFVSTVRDLDMMRDRFTFEQKAIKSYELGIRLQDTNQSVGGAGGGKQEGEVSSLVDRIEEMESTMIKVENLMLLFNERLEELEHNK